ncbi:hypothetical protein [Embleya sp. AB8]|uniref:hypothetical protein n=1 Tax=Embleya sp. AB8 TaxID=3156304 RepID=UPI003C7166BA
MTRQPDDTVRGIVIPLIVVAVVCVLLTSGVFLFAFAGSDDGKGPDRPVSLDLNVPLPASVPPPGTAPASPGAVTASATKSATRSPAASTSASASATAGTTSPSAPPRATTPAAPPATPPPATTGPQDISVDATTSNSGWGADGTVVITNRTSRPLPTWDLTLTTSGRGNGFTMMSGDGARTSLDRGTAIARGTGPLAPGASVVIDFGLYGRVDTIGCTFTGVTCRVRGSDAGHW